MAAFLPAEALVAAIPDQRDGSSAALALARGDDAFRGTFAQLKQDGAGRDRWRSGSVQMDLLTIDAEAAGLAFAQSVRLGGARLEIGAGMARQGDSLPGLGLAGAFGGGGASSRFLSLATSQELATRGGARTELRFGTEIGKSRYDSGGILRAARVSTASVDALISREGADDQAWRAGVQLPMTVLDAEFDLDLPQAMAATAGAERNTGVLRERGTRSAGGAPDIRPIVDVSWSKDVAQGGRLGMGLSLDPDRPRNSAIATSFAMRF